MTSKVGALVPVLKSWRQIYGIYNLLKQSEDQICTEYGLTAEQYSVLMVVDYAGGSARPSDIAQWLIRSPNSISMIVDRMVKVGLVKRTRDRADRRVVNVTATGKGKAAAERANVAVLEFVRKVFQPLSQEDENTLSGLLGTVRYEILRHSNHGAETVDIKELKRIESKQIDTMVRWLGDSSFLSAPEGKRRRRAGRSRESLAQ
jgi:DNA-binding MarR family transcriptional regulator